MPPVNHAFGFQGAGCHVTGAHLSYSLMVYLEWPRVQNSLALKGRSGCRIFDAKAMSFTVKSGQLVTYYHKALTLVEKPTDALGSQLRVGIPEGGSLPKAFSRCPTDAKGNSLPPSPLCMGVLWTRLTTLIRKHHCLFLVPPNNSWFTKSIPVMFVRLTH